MKYYSKKKIEKIVREVGGDLQRIEVGLDGDWALTARVVYENGEYKNFRMDGNKMIISGFAGSDRLTPTARVYLTDGSHDRIPVGTEELETKVEVEPEVKPEPEPKPKPVPKRRPAPKKKN